jgi:VIT1/CCC1 family predicted Fe2+/Mn2+ transporter
MKGNRQNSANREAISEKVRVARLSRIRQILFGSLDGLLVPLGVVSAVAGGTQSSKAVIVAGLAEAFAGALSMGAGEFISGRAEAQVHRAEVQSELDGMQSNPEYELQEMVQLLQSEGVNPVDAQVIAERLQRNPHSYARTMVEKELGLDFQPDTLRIADAVAMSFSYLIASIVPLIAYFFLPIDKAFVLSLLLSILFLIMLGLVRGIMAKLNLLISVIEILGIGILSGLGGYYLGVWLPSLFGY